MSIRLSICIPTRNRCAQLRRSLESLTSSPFFADHPDIEVVISDNASTDNTQATAQEFMSRYGDRVKYFRNEVDLKDRNFETALRRGQGKYLKLLNDTVLWEEHGIKTIYDLVLAHETDSPLIFVLNRCKQTDQPIFELDGLNAFVQTVSFYMGWIGGFGIWKHQLDAMPDFSRKAATSLAQVDVLLRLIQSSPRIIICNTACFKVQDTVRKGGYSLAKVFGEHYLKMLQDQAAALSGQTYAEEKQQILLKHILPFHFDPRHDFHLQPLEEILEPIYGSEHYYGPAIKEARDQWIEKMKAAQSKKQRPAWKRHLENFGVALMLKLKPGHFKSLSKLWRIQNRHNDTQLGRPCDFGRVQVGRSSYGTLNIHSWGHQDERLVIGHYVSIAENVQFLLGGNHQTDGLSSFPFKVMVLGHDNETRIKGPITVEDDVWIGYGAMILSGVTLHQGCVIGAGAVVSSDIPPYAIAAGNPAKVVKYRFDSDLRDKLTQMDLGQLNNDAVLSRPDLIAEKVTTENVDQIIQGLNLLRSKH